MDIFSCWMVAGARCFLHTNFSSCLLTGLHILALGNGFPSTRLHFPRRVRLPRLELLEDGQVDVVGEGVQT